MKMLKILAILISLFALSACSTLVRTNSVYLHYASPIGVVPFLNNSQTPAAGVSASEITANILRSKGSACVVNYPLDRGAKIVLPGVQYQISKAQMWQFAKRHHLQYLLTGTVTEWHYKAGIDGEPAVGFTLQLIDVSTHQVLWSGAAAQTGTSRQGVAIIAQQLLRNTLANICFSR
jgi:TolB-like protein